MRERTGGAVSAERIPEKEWLIWSERTDLCAGEWARAVSAERIWNSGIPDSGREDG